MLACDLLLFLTQLRVGKGRLYVREKQVTIQMLDT